MAAPAVASKGTAAAGTGASISPSLPASIAANDIVWILVLNHTATTTPGAISLPAGWTEATPQFTYRSSGSVIVGVAALYWKRMSGGETGTITVSRTGTTGNTTLLYAQTYRETGCVTSGDPFDDCQGTDGVGGLTMTFAAISVLGTERTLLAFGANGANATQSGPGTYLSTPTIVSDGTTTGSDGSLRLSHLDNQSTDGSKSGSSANATASGWASFHVSSRATTPGTVYTDSATVRLALRPSGTEARISTDAGTGLLKLTPSSADVRAAVDSNTVYLHLVPSGTEGKVISDSGTVRIKFTPSGTEFKGGPKFQTVSSSFDSGIPIPPFDTVTDGLNTVTAVSGKVQLTLADINAGPPALVTQGELSLYDSYSMIEVVSVTSSPDFYLGFYGMEPYQMVFSNGVLTAYGSGFTDSLASASVGTCPRWLRLRHNSSTHLVYYEYTNDISVGWTVLATKDVTVAETQPGFHQGRMNTELGILTLSGTSATAVVDNYNKVVLYDAATVTLKLTPSGTDTAQRVDAGTARLNLVPSGTEFQGKEYTDSNTVRIKLVPSSADIAQYVESNTVRLKLVPSSTDVATYVDSNTVRLKLTPSSVETAQRVDSASIRLTLTPSSTQVFAGVDAATARVTLTPSGTDQQIGAAADSGTVRLSFTPSSTQVFAGVDAQTVRLKLIPSAVETAQRVDASTVRLVLTPSSTQVFAGVDATTVRLKLTPSGTEQKVSAGDDLATIRLALTPSSVSTLATVDSATVPVRLTPTAVEVLQTVDAATMRLKLTPSGTDLRTIVDTGAVRLALTPSGTESLTRDDAGTVRLTLRPSSVELSTYIDSDTIPLRLVPSTTELFATQDSATIRLSLIPSGVEFIALRITTDLRATAVNRWVIISASIRWSVSLSAANRWVLNYDRDRTRV